METNEQPTPGGSIAQYFGSLKDPRVTGRCDHDLLDVLTITFLAVICGAEGWDAIEDWACFREDWLRTFLRLPNGIPGDEIHSPTVHSAETTDGDHGRVEIRRTHVTTDGAWFTERTQWAGLKSFVWTERKRHVGTSVTREQCYFVSSLDTTEAALMGSYVRGHWGIENTLHWSLDVTFHQDASRIRRDHAPQNFAAVRKLALVPLKAETTFKAGIERMRRRADRDLDYLLAVLNAGGRAS